MQLNTLTIQKEMEWFEKVLQTRLDLYFKGEASVAHIFDLPIPDVSEDESIYADILNHYQFNTAERLILILALIPHLAPYKLDTLFTKNKAYDRFYTEFGGIPATHHKGFLPTGETVTFIIAGTNLEERLLVLDLLSTNHAFYKSNILKLESSKAQEPQLSGLLSMSDEYLSLLTYGRTYTPKYSPKFPASLLETKMEWDDLVLNDVVFDEIQLILDWLKYQDQILGHPHLSKYIKPGYRALFYGPPGTGKTLTATLLGKATGKQVYRVDISQMVSKYIGETEKNLASLFDQAENRDWILFFDEADALFGARTQTVSSNDRHSNQEIAYLLQRIEDYPNMVILCTNLKGNIDEAFSRRFQSMIYFPLPSEEQRQVLWEQAFQSVPLDESVDFQQVAADHEISGGLIGNILRLCLLYATHQEDGLVRMVHILEGVRRELGKDGF